MLRQRRSANPSAPRIAPTAMKTVPSGRFDCCMKGALFVGGTLGGGYVGITPGPVKVGNPVSSPPVVASAPPVMVGLPVGSAVTREPVLLIETLSVFEGVVVSLDFVSLLGVGVDFPVSLADGVVEGVSSLLVGEDFWAIAGATRAMAERSIDGPGK